ncbi:MAG: hypothetical protein H6834_15930 [Planctomycetes bacterium]|nr:hypothetical protein [Planctomycetota bacterium]
MEDFNGRSSQELLPGVYEQLRKLASAFLQGERPGHTLQPTALVHEAYLRLTGHEEQHSDGAGHFFASAARTMRRILVEHVRRKRRGPSVQVELCEVHGACIVQLDHVLALDEALTELANRDERLARIVELRCFAGLSVERVGEVLGISERTVQREWATFHRAPRLSKKQYAPWMEGDALDVVGSNDGVASGVDFVPDGVECEGCTSVCSVSPSVHGAERERQCRAEGIAHQQDAKGGEPDRRGG